MNIAVDWTSKVRRFNREQSSGLFIGVQQFKYFQPVAYAVDDAIDLAWHFAVELQLIPPQRVTLCLAGQAKKEITRRKLAALLLDGARQEQANYSSVLESLAALPNAGDGLQVVTIASHGKEWRGKNFFLVSDTCKTFENETRLDINELLSSLQERSGTVGRQLVLIDACRDNLSGSNARTTTPIENALSEDFIEAIGKEQGMAIIFGTKKHGFCYDDDCLQNGVFSAAIIDGLWGAAERDERGFITVQTLSIHASKKIKEWVETHRPHDRFSKGTTGNGELQEMPLACFEDQREPGERKREAEARLRDREDLDDAIIRNQRQAQIQGIRQVLDASPEMIANILAPLEAPRVGEALKQARTLMAAGSYGDAVTLLQKLTRGGVWASFLDEERAKVLRLLVRAMIGAQQDPATTRECLEKAEALDGQSDSYEHILLTSTEKDSATALKLIGDPQDIATFNLKLRLLLEKNDIDAALDLLRQRPNNLEPNEETRWLHAVLLLETNQRDAALLKMEKNPGNHINTRIILAITRFCSVLSPVLQLGFNWQMPYPVNLAFIKTDSISAKNLEQATQDFASLVNETHDQWRKQALNIWLLKCLCLAPEKRSEAETLANELLEVDCFNFHATLCALYFALIDESLLRERRTAFFAQENHAEHPKVIERSQIHVDLLCRCEHFMEGLVFWEQVKHLFVAKGREHDWNRAYFGMMRNVDREKAEAFVSEHSELAVQTTTQPCEGEDQNFGDRLYKLYQLGDHVSLWHFIKLKEEEQDWETVAAHTEVLIGFQTSKALCVVLKALYNLRNAQEFLDVLEEHRHYFPDGHLIPEDVERGRLDALVQLGRLDEAQEASEMLALAEPSTRNITWLMYVLALKWDFQAAAVQARKLVDREDLSAFDALQITAGFVIEEPELARQFWRKARSAGIEEGQLTSAMFLGRQLGLSAEAHALLPAAIKAGEALAVSLKDTPEHFRRLKQQTHQNLEDYRYGRVPVHLLPEIQHHPLFDLYKMARNKDQPQATFIYHGDRQPKSCVEKPKRLFLDVTALYTAFELGILDIVERFFPRIIYSPMLVSLLSEEERKLIPNQPEVQKNLDTIYYLLQRGALQVAPAHQETAVSYPEFAEQMGHQWVSLLENYQNRNAYVVENFPLLCRNWDWNSSTIPAAIPPEPLRGSILNVGTLLRALPTIIGLPQNKLEKKLQDLSSENQRDLKVELNERAEIYLDGETALKLAELGLLEQVATGFARVYISLEMKQRVELNHRTTKENHETSESLKRLKTRLRDGPYHLMPNLPNSRQLSPSRNINQIVLVHMLEGAHLSGDLLWIDDRYVTGFPSNGDSNPIVGIMDILATLRAADEIDDDQYFDLVCRLRESHKRFIVLSEEELSYHLEQATIDKDGALIETPGLAAIRRYIGACLYDSRNLKVAKECDENKVGDEIFWLLRTSNFLIQAIVSEWFARDFNLKYALAKSKWILFNLYSGLFSGAPIDSEVRQSLDVFNLQTPLIDAFFKSCTLLKSEDLLERTSLFLQWYVDFILFPARMANADLLKPLSEDYAHSLAKIIEGLPSVVVKEFQKKISKYYLMSSVVFQHDIPKNKHFIDLVGVCEIVQIGEIIFRHDELVKGISQIYNGRKRHVLNEYHGVKFSLARESCDSNAVIVASLCGDRTYRLEDPKYGTLHPKTKIVRQSLEELRIAFDLSDESFERTCKKILKERKGFNRIQQCFGLLKRSAFVFYNQFENDVEKNIKEQNFLPNSLDGLRSHFRLTPAEVEADWGQNFQLSAERLITEHGVAETLERLAGFPTLLPDAVNDAFLELSKVERKRMIFRFRRIWLTPFHRIHLIQLALLVMEDEPVFYQELMAGILHEFQIEALLIEQFNLQLTLIQLIYALVCGSDQVRAWSASARLAMSWLHSGRILNILFYSIADYPALSHYFGWKHRSFLPDVLEPEKFLLNDVAHPLVLKLERLIPQALCCVRNHMAPDFFRHFNLEGWIKEITCNEVDDAFFPKTAFLVDLSSKSNVLSTFFDIDPLPPIFKDDWRTKMVRERFTILEQQPGQTKAWELIEGIIGDRTAPQALHQALAAACKNLDLEVFKRMERLPAWQILRFAASHSGLGEGSHLRRHLKELFLGLLEIDVIGAHQPEEYCPVLETALYLLRGDDPQQMLIDFTDLMKRVFPIDPSLMKRYHRIVFRMAMDLPRAMHRPLWELVYFIRSRMP